MAVSAHDVARELRHRVPGAGNVQTHKFLYYCQGWHLAWTGSPLFEERIEAWTNGPVVADLWHVEHDGAPAPAPRELDEGALATIEFVVNRYGRLSKRELVDLTHSEDPWRLASQTGEANAEITHDHLRAWFVADPDETGLARMAAELGTRDDLRRAVEASSAPRTSPVRDETDDLARLLSSM